MFYSILTFRNSIGNLKKKDRDGYLSCNKDVCDYLSQYTFDDIWEMNTRLREFGNIRLLKIRLQDSHQKLSKADGYRLIICCNKNYNSVTFLNIYPKRRKHGQLDQPKEEYKHQLNSYLASLKHKSLIQHNIKNELAEIEKVD